MASEPAQDAIGSVLNWLREWGAEVADANIAAGRQRFADDLWAFGTYADVVTSRDRVEEQQWATVWPTIEDFAFMADDAHILLGTDGLMAVIVTRWTSTGIADDGSSFDRPGRATIVLRRDDLSSRWLGVHTHFSLAKGVPATSHGARSAIR